MKAPVYIDFESNKKGELFLLSVKLGEVTTTYILDDRLKPLAESKLARNFNLVVAEADDVIKSLSELWNGEAQPVGAYSQNERHILKEQFGLDIPFYLDIHKLAKKWINRNYKAEFEKLPTYKPKSKNWHEKGGTWSLEAIARWQKLGIPKNYGRGKTTSRINAILNGFNSKGNYYSKLTSLRKKNAKHLLEHNVFDVEGLEKLYLRIQEESPELVRRILSK